MSNLSNYFPSLLKSFYCWWKIICDVFSCAVVLYHLRLHLLEVNAKLYKDMVKIIFYFGSSVCVNRQIRSFPETSWHIVCCRRTKRVFFFVAKMIIYCLAYPPQPKMNISEKRVKSRFPFYHESNST